MNPLELIKALHAYLEQNPGSLQEPIILHFENGPLLLLDGDTVSFDAGIMHISLAELDTRDADPPDFAGPPLSSWSPQPHETMYGD